MATTPSSRGQDARKHDALSVFTVVFAHCLALQVAKDAQSLSWRTSAAVPTLLLAASVAAAHVAPKSDVPLVALALSGVFVLFVNGSQSNHVLLELAIAAAVLLTAPSSSSFDAVNADADVDGAARARRRRRREAFSERVTLSMRAILVVLYAMTGFTKLNDAWHDPSLSCCVQMFVGALAAVGVSPKDTQLCSPAVLNAMPYAATAFELGFPAVLLASLALGGRTGRAGVRALTISGALFHVFIALPPPPMSVYPFSMIMAPVYVMALVPEECGAAARAAEAAPRSLRVAAAAALAALTAYAVQLNRASDYFEYPAYFAWEVGVLWVVLAFGGIAAVAAAGELSSSSSLSPLSSPSPPTTTPVNGKKKRPGFGGAGEGGEAARGGEGKYTYNGGSRATAAAGAAGPLGSVLLPLLPAIFVFIVSASTFLGVRTYPSFAMFSNLLLEGGASNHWVVRAPLRFDVNAAAASASGASLRRYYGPHVAVEVLDTDLPALRNLQVNLAPLLPPRVLAALAAANVTPEFHITPPNWKYSAGKRGKRDGGGAGGYWHHSCLYSSS